MCVLSSRVYVCVCLQELKLSFSPLSFHLSLAMIRMLLNVTNGVILYDSIFVPHESRDYTQMQEVICLYIPQTLNPNY